MKTLQGNKSVLKQQYDTTYTTEKVWCIKFNKTSKIYYERKGGVQTLDLPQDTTQIMCKT